MEYIKYAVGETFDLFRFLFALILPIIPFLLFFAVGIWMGYGLDAYLAGDAGFPIWRVLCTVASFPVSVFLFILIQGYLWGDRY